MDRSKSIRYRLNKACAAWLIVALFLGGCIQIEGNSPVTQTPFLITATLPPSPTPFPSNTPLPPTAVPTIAPVVGKTTTQVNVRSGPGKDFESLGLINPNETVSILGKDSSGAWIQIQYSPSPDGTGWVAAQFLQVDNADALVVIDVVTPTTESPQTAPTTESAPSKLAIADNDTANSPLARFKLAATESRTFQIQGDVSAPAGDMEDWLIFSSESANILVSVSCESDALHVELQQNKSTVQALSAPCGKEFQLITQPNTDYLLRIYASGTESVYVRYHLRVSVRQ